MKLPTKTRGFEITLKITLMYGAQYLCISDDMEIYRVNPVQPNPLNVPTGEKTMNYWRSESNNAHTSWNILQTSHSPRQSSLTTANLSHQSDSAPHHSAADRVQIGSSSLAQVDWIPNFDHINSSTKSQYCLLCGRMAGISHAQLRVVVVYIDRSYVAC